jgi:uncharacterized coiled-coil protein SlyX
LRLCGFLQGAKIEAMSQYRDDQEAARHRLESLEEKLAARDAELESHKQEIAERDREISRLARELRSAGTQRIVTSRRNSGARLMVAGAMSAAIVAGMIGFLSVRRAAVEPMVTFAELPSPQLPLAAPHLDTQVAEHDQLARENRELREKIDRSRLEAEVNALTRKVTSGSASASEVERFLELSKRLGPASHAGDAAANDSATP